MHFYYCCKKCKKQLSFATAAAVAVFVTPTGFEAGPMRKKAKAANIVENGGKYLHLTKFFYSF